MPQINLEGWERTKKNVSIPRGNNNSSTPYQNYEEAASSLPNFEKLTKMEQSIFQFLPQLQESSVVQALQKFSESPFGKVLNYLDVGAEFVERGTGFISQAGTELLSGDQDRIDGFKSNLADAWYAGSLTADFVNLPKMQHDDEGNFIGFSVPTDLPGSYGLMQAREKITALVGQGMDRGEALTLVREDWYNNAGALALRSQLNDAYFHMLGDPINVVMPMLKPAERIKTLALTARITKVTPEGLSMAQNALKLAEQAGDVAEATRITSLIDDASGKLLTRMDRVAIALTGGDDLKPISDLSRAEVFMRKFNPFSLTPESRAQEMLTRVYDNTLNYVVSNFDDPADMVASLNRAAGASVGNEWGHAMMTLEGRTVQAALGGFQTYGDDMLLAFRAAGDQRNMLETIARALDDNPHTIFDAINADDVDQLIGRLGKVEGGEALADLLRAPEILESVKSLDGVPWSPELFKVHLTNQLADHTARQAILMFGVKQRGFVQKLSNAVKSAETLVFLRANPGFAVRNLINNEFTMVARGIMPFMRTSQDGAKFLFGKTDDLVGWFQDELGFLPKRFAQSFGDGVDTGLPAAGSAVQGKGVLADAARLAETAGDDVIAKALDGDIGFLGKARKFFSDVPLGKLDAGDWSANIERSASIRAWVSGYSQAWRQYWKPGKGFARVSDRVQGLGDDLGRTIDSAIASARSPAEIDKALIGNMNINMDAILAEAKLIHGEDISGLFPDDFVTSFQKGFVEATENGNVTSYMEGLRGSLQNHLDDLNDARVAGLADEIAEKIATGHQGEVLKTWGNMQDEWWGAHAAYGMEMQRLDPSNITDPILRGKTWKLIKDKQTKYWARAWNRFDATIKGMKTGAAKAGLEIPDNAFNGFNKWRKETRSFFTTRNRLHSQYFDATGAGKLPKKSWDNILEELDNKYRKLIETEDVVSRQMDEMVSKGFITDNPEMAELFLAGRNRAAELRLADKESVLAFRAQIRGLDADEVTQAYRAHWGERVERWKEIHKVGRIESQALQGDPDAAFFLGSLAESRGIGDTRYLASRYGVATASPSGKPTDDHLLGIVNKHLQGRYDPGAAKELDLIGDPDAVSRLGDIATKQRHELDPEMSGLVEQMARQLQDELNSASKGGAVQETAGDATVRGKSDLEWWSNVSDEGFAHKDTMHNALQRIIDDGGKDADAVYVNRARELIQDRLQGEADSGQFPDLAAFIQTRGEGVASGADVLRNLDTQIEGLQKKLDDLIARLGKSSDPADEFRMATANDQLQNAIAARDGLGKRFAEGDTFDDQAGLFNQQIAGFQKYNKVEEVPFDLAAEALEARRVFNGDPEVEVPGFTGVEGQASVVDMDYIVKPEAPIMENTDQLSYVKSFDALDSLETAARNQMDKPPSLFDDLDDATKVQVQRHVQLAKDELLDTRYAASRMAEWKRDSALLNYNRRYNYNTWLGAVAPYEFWMTQSAMKWAIHSIDRPAMLSTFMRMKKFMDTAGAPGQGFPSRLRGQIRIPIPFLPEWMGGGIFVDPMKVALPFETFLNPYEERDKRSMAAEGRTERLLQEWADAGSADAGGIKEAMETHSGAVWDAALAQVMKDDEDLKFDGWDFASMLVSPHAPLIWAKEVAQGTPENIGPFAPLTRTSRGISNLFGIDPWFAPHNIEGSIRKGMGLPAFDQWDDYRIDRMISNMVADNTITLEEAQLAMIDRTGDAYDLAVRRSEIEFGIQAGIGSLGIPMKAYPEGEAIQRSLADDFSNAYQQWDQGDVGALTDFFEEHPEYEARLALWKSPEERMQNFLVDRIWSQYADMPKVHKDQLRDSLGAQFNVFFVDRESRSYDDIPNELLGSWLRLMGGSPPGSLNSPAIPVDMAPPEIANQAQVFYDMRNDMFGDWYGTQTAYFDLDEGARKGYLNNHPELIEYWDWRRDFFHRNPKVVPYVDDNFEFSFSSEAAREEAFSAPLNFTQQEWSMVLPSGMTNLLQASFTSGTGLNGLVRDELEVIASNLGISVGQLIADYRRAINQGQIAQP